MYLLQFGLDHTLTTGVIRYELPQQAHRVTFVTVSLTFIPVNLGFAFEASGNILGIPLLGIT